MGGKNLRDNVCVYNPFIVFHLKVHLVSLLNLTNYLSLFELKHSLSRDQATLRACVRFLVCILFALLEATYGHLYPAL